MEELQGILEKSKYTYEIIQHEKPLQEVSLFLYSMTGINSSIKATILTKRAKMKELHCRFQTFEKETIPMNRL